MAGSVTVLMVLVIIFIIRSVKENSLVVSCPDTLVVVYGSTDDEADINETIIHKTYQLSHLNIILYGYYTSLMHNKPVKTLRKSSYFGY